VAELRHVEEVLQDTMRQLRAAEGEEEALRAKVGHMRHEADVAQAACDRARVAEAAALQASALLKNPSCPLLLYTSESLSPAVLVMPARSLLRGLSEVAAAEVDWTCKQGASKAAERAQAAVREGEEAVARVQEQYEGALAEVNKLVKERQRWQEAWDEERQRMEADKAALAASMEVSCDSHPCLQHSAVTFMLPSHVARCRRC
jgi:hypothetical protein